MHEQPKRKSLIGVLACVSWMTSLCGCCQVQGNHRSCNRSNNRHPHHFTCHKKTFSFHRHPRHVPTTSSLAAVSLDMEAFDQACFGVALSGLRLAEWEPPTQLCGILGAMATTPHWRCQCRINPVVMAPSSHPSCRLGVRRLSAAVSRSATPSRIWWALLVCGARARPITTAFAHTGYGNSWKHLHCLRRGLGPQRFLQKWCFIGCPHDSHFTSSHSSVSLGSWPCVLFPIPPSQGGQSCTVDYSTQIRPPRLWWLSCACIWASGLFEGCRAAPVFGPTTWCLRRKHHFSSFWGVWALKCIFEILLQWVCRHSYGK